MTQPYFNTFGTIDFNYDPNNKLHHIRSSISNADYGCSFCDGKMLSVLSGNEIETLDDFVNDIVNSLGDDSKFIFMELIARQRKNMVIKNATLDLANKTINVFAEVMLDTTVDKISHKYVIKKSPE